jgi:hypothetical protein
MRAVGISRQRSVEELTRDRDGELTSFDGPAGSTFPFPTGINDSGAITGDYYITTTSPGCRQK